MTRLLMIVAVMVPVLAVSRVLAASLIPVPNPDAASATARFSSLAPNVFRAEGDGATALLDDMALIRALDGARISVETVEPGAAPLLDILRGTVTVYVAEGTVRLRLGGAVVAVSNAELLIHNAQGEWFLLLTNLEVDGGAVLMDAGGRPDRGDGPRFVDGIAPTAEPRFMAGLRPIGIPLLPNRVERLIQNRVLPANERDTARIKSVGERMFAKRREAALTPVPVETASDLTVDTSGAVDDASSVEIETVEVEIEAGCVEVCHD